MFRTRHQVCTLLLAGWLAAPTDAAAQSGAASAPSPESFALYDQLVGPVISRAGLGAPPADETPAAGCRRQAVVAEVMIRFAIAATLPPGATIDNSRAEQRRQAVDLLVDDARAALNRLAGADTTLELCSAAARGFGAAGFEFAQSINRANVQRNVQALLPPPKPPGPPERTEEEMAAEEAAKAASDRLQAEKAEAERLAQAKVEHAYANLGAVTSVPVPRTSRAQPLTFNVYLVDTPATREVKNFKLCFEPGLYQRAAKPVVDLASAVLEVPEATAVITATVDDFHAKLAPIIAQKLNLPADRLTIENADGDVARGPSADLVRAVSSGCHVYLAGRAPTIAHDDGTTTFGLLAENQLEDIVLRPALEARQAAQSKLEALPATPTVAEGEPAPPPPRPEVVACGQNARCRAGVRVAVNACLQVAERRLGKAAVARQLEVRQRVTAQMRAKPDDEAAEKEFQLVSGNLEMIDGTLGQTLDKLAKAAPTLRQQAASLLTNQEVDAAVTAGRTEGEQAMGAPVLQCQARLADGRAAGLTVTR